MTTPNDQSLASQLSAIATSSQPKITQSGDTLTITFKNGETYTLQRKTSREVRSQSIKAR